jgi:DNA adenine methylase
VNQTTTKPASLAADGPKRAVLRYFGGKWAIAPWVLRHLPPHRIYVEPFGGAASVLMRKTRSEIEVYNDLDSEIVSLFRVIQDPMQCAALMRKLRRTPYARAEFDQAFMSSTDPVVTAQRTIIRAYLSFHHASVFDPRKRSFADARHRTGSGRGKAGEWVTYPRSLVAVRRRLQGVVIECRDALAVIKAQDTPQTLHFVDPPYVPSTRSDTGYRHELTTQQHVELLEVLLGCKGMVVLAGYPSALYDEMLVGWRRVERAHFAVGVLRQPRTEVLWISPRAADALP